MLLDIVLLFCIVTVSVCVSFLRVTNGGKTTLTDRLTKILPNCCVVHQDDFFKVSIYICVCAPSAVDECLRCRMREACGLCRDERSRVHLTGVCFSPKMRLKLVKMALSSMMVSWALIRGFVCVFSSKVPQ